MSGYLRNRRPLRGGLPWRYIAAHCDDILNVERLDKAWHSAGDVKQENWLKVGRQGKAR